MHDTCVSVVLHVVLYTYTYGTVNGCYFVCKHKSVYIINSNTKQKENTQFATYINDLYLVGTQHTSQMKSVGNTPTTNLKHHLSVIFETHHTYIYKMKLTHTIRYIHLS
jgi:hypothetical protein